MSAFLTGCISAEVDHSISESSAGTPSRLTFLQQKQQQQQQQQQQARRNCCDCLLTGQSNAAVNSQTRPVIQAGRHKTTSSWASTVHKYVPLAYPQRITHSSKTATCLRPPATNAAAHISRRAQDRFHHENKQSPKHTCSATSQVACRGSPGPPTALAAPCTAPP
jgi:hypothetical protein